MVRLEFEMFLVQVDLLFEKSSSLVLKSIASLTVQQQCGRFPKYFKVSDRHEIKNCVQTPFFARPHLAVICMTVTVSASRLFSVIS